MTDYGFVFGPAIVERRASVDRSNGRYFIIGVTTKHAELNIYVSPTGKSVRVFRNHKELKPCTSPS